MEKPLPDFPYFAFVSRARKRPAVDVWPIGHAERLPPVPVPLLPGDADVTLDLQAALTAVYDGVGYDLILDYGRPAGVVMSVEEREWARRVLVESGRVPGVS